MPVKTGEITYLPVTLQTRSGTPVTYASKTALTTAGWTFAYWSAGVVVSSPTWTWTVVDATNGRGEIGLTVQAGQGEAYLLPPSGFSVNVETFMLDVEDSDLDSIYSTLSTAAGTPSSDERTLTTDFEVTEGDTFQTSLTVPLAAISGYGLTDLSTITSITAAARTRINRIDTSPDFTFQAWISSAASRTVNLSWATFPTGASISGFTVTSVSTASKTFTVTGDKRSFFDGITRVLVANSSGNDGYYTVTGTALTAGSTVFTVSETIASSVADGTLAQADETKDFLYDVPMQAPKTIAITAVSTVSKTFTMAGDQQRWFNVGCSITVTGSTGNDGTYTVTAIAYTGGNTVLTVSEAVPSAVADGSVRTTFKITGLKGTITIVRQEDRL